MLRRSLVLVLALLGAGPVHATGLLIPADKDTPPLAMVNHQVDVSIDDQVAVTRVDPDLPQPHRQAARSDLCLPRPQGRQRQQVHHVGRRQGGAGRTGRGRQGPPGLHRHRPPHPGPRPARIHRQQPAPPARLPRPGPRRPEGVASASPPCRARRRPGRVRLPAQDRRQGRRHPGEVLACDATLEVAARACRTSTAPPTPSRSSATATTRPTSTSSATQAVLDKDFQLLLHPGRQGRRSDRCSCIAPDAGQDGHFMLLISPRGPSCRRSSSVPRDMVFVLDTSRQHGRAPRWSRPARRCKFCLDQPCRRRIASP